MGAIEPAAFVAACKQKFSADEAEAKAIELTAFWQERLQDPEWYPFKVIEVNGDVVVSSLFITLLPFVSMSCLVLEMSMVCV